MAIHCRAAKNSLCGTIPLRNMLPCEVQELSCLVFKKFFHWSSVLWKQLKRTVKLNLTAVLGVLTTLLVYTF